MDLWSWRSSTRLARLTACSVKEDCNTQPARAFALVARRPSLTGNDVSAAVDLQVQQMLGTNLPASAASPLAPVSPVATGAPPKPPKMKDGSRALSRNDISNPGPIPCTPASYRRPAKRSPSVCLIAPPTTALPERTHAHAACRVAPPPAGLDPPGATEVLEFLKNRCCMAGPGSFTSWDSRGDTICAGRLTRILGLAQKP